MFKLNLDDSAKKKSIYHENLTYEFLKMEADGKKPDKKMAGPFSSLQDKAMKSDAKPINLDKEITRIINLIKDRRKLEKDQIILLNWQLNRINAGYENSKDVPKPRDHPYKKHGLSYGDSALHFLSKYGDMESIQKLIDSGVDVNVKDAEGFTPLHKSLHMWSKHLFKFLLKQKGVDVNTRMSDGITPLIYTIINFRDDLAVDLINAGADVTLTDKKGDTPLHIAIKSQQKTVIKALLAAGADPNAPNDCYFNPLHTAVVIGTLSVFRILLDHNAIDINARTAPNKRLTPLMIASRLGVKDMVRELINKGADIKATDANGETALHHAARCRRANNTRILLAAGADVNARDNAGRTPLISAAAALDVKLYRLLLFQNATIKTMVGILINAFSDINAADNDGKTALHHAVRNKRSDAIDKLLYEGADVNAQDKEGRTPLHEAVEANVPDIVLTLLYTVGIKPKIRMNDGRSPLMLTSPLKKNAYYIGTLLIGRCSLSSGKQNCDTYLHWMVATHNTSAIGVYLKSYPSHLNLQNAEGQTPLFIAASLNDFKTCKFLLEQSADKTIKDHNGKDPRDIAKEKGYYKIFRLFNNYPEQPSM